MKPICSFAGCARTIECKGLCKSHNAQRLRGQKLRPIQALGKAYRCSFDGCGRPIGASKRGLCKPHAIQARKGFDLHPLGVRRDAASAETRFWRSVDRNGPISSDGTPCWMWTAGGCPQGYGIFKVGAKRMLTHRFSWELVNGPLPDDRPHETSTGTCVLHRCDNPPCVNPSHLFTGTHRKNADDREAKGRGNHASHEGEANGVAKLMSADIIEIRRTPVSRGTTARLSRQFGVSWGTINRVIQRRAWRHL